MHTLISRKVLVVEYITYMIKIHNVEFNAVYRMSFVVNEMTFDVRHNMYDIRCITYNVKHTV